MVFYFYKSSENINNQELIKRLIYDLKNHANMQDSLCLQKCEALRTLYVREDDFSHARGDKLRVQKKN